MVKNKPGRKGLISSYAYSLSWREIRQGLEQELEAEITEECCLLALPSGLRTTLLYSSGPSA